MATVKDLDTRLDEQDKAFADFRGEVRTLIMISKGLVAFSAAAVLAIVAQLFTVARTAGNLESAVTIQSQEFIRLRDKVDQMRDRNETFAREQERLSTRADQSAKDLARLEQKVDSLADTVKQLVADLRKDRPAK